MSLELRDLIQAFQQLNVRKTRALIGAAPASDDLHRTIAAWLALSEADENAAEAQLASLAQDGTVRPADVAYVRAVMADMRGDFESIIALLEPHFADTEALHAHRLRLRSADALLKLRQFEAAQEVLRPFLEPPGVTGTLEAHFIVLQGMMATNMPKDRLIEQVALIDGLIEKGFRLTEANTVIFYAGYLLRYRIEPPIGPLLNAHESLVDGFETDDNDLIALLLSAGDKYRAPCAVRAAGRSYARAPFPLEGIDIERAAYLFSSHEEHEAARQAFLLGYPKSRIHKEQSLWGPLLLATYCAGHNKEALDIIREHREEIPRLKHANNIRLVKVLCEFGLRRFAEALRGMQELDIRFYDQATPGEACAYPMALIATGAKPEAVIQAIMRGVDVRIEDQKWTNEFSTAILTQLAVHERVEELKLWVVAMQKALHVRAIPDVLQRVGDMGVEWAIYPLAEEAYRQLIQKGEVRRAALLKAFIEGDQGNQAGMEEQFALALGSSAPTPDFLLLRARLRRRAGNQASAIADLELILQKNDYPRRHAALAILEGIYREKADHARIDETRNLINSFIAANATGDQATMMGYEASQLVAGDSPGSLLFLATKAQAAEPEGIELLRLVRKAQRAYDATPEQRTFAKTIRDAWEKKHLILPLGTSD